MSLPIDFPRDPDARRSDKAFLERFIPLAAIALTALIPVGRAASSQAIAAEFGMFAAILLFREALSVEAPEEWMGREDWLAILKKVCYYTAGFLLLFEVRLYL
jgi:hypothetical protein